MSSQRKASDMCVASLYRFTLILVVRSVRGHGLTNILRTVPRENDAVDDQDDPARIKKCARSVGRSVPGVVGLEFEMKQLQK